MRSLFALCVALIGVPSVDSLSSNIWKRKIADAANCEQGLDILFVQDTTGSLQPRLARMTAEIEGLLSEIEKAFVHTRAGVVQFKDKPIDPLGVPGLDFCYDLSQPLTTDMSDLRDAYASFRAGGGGDLPEATYHALWDVTHDGRVGWRPFAKTSELSPDVSAARIILLLTDAQPHFEGSLKLPKFPGTSRTVEEFAVDCLEHDYPSPEIIKKALDDKQALLISLIARDPIVDALSAWQWVNGDLLSQPDEFCVRVDDNATDMKDEILRIFRLIRDEIPCGETTTVPPTTITSTSTTSPMTTEVNPTTVSVSASTETTDPKPTMSDTVEPATSSPLTATGSPTAASDFTRSTWTAASDLESTTPSDESSSSHCGCHCGCGCGCGCSHQCSGGHAYAPQFVFNIPAGVATADISVRDIAEGLAALPGV